MCTCEVAYDLQNLIVNVDFETSSFRFSDLLSLSNSPQSIPIQYDISFSKPKFLPPCRVDVLSLPPCKAFAKLPFPFYLLDDTSAFVPNVSTEFYIYLLNVKCILSPSSLSLLLFAAKSPFSILL